MTGPINLRLLDRLVADGLITAEQQEAAHNFVQRTGDRVEEALLEVNAIEETALLKWLAAQHRTRFVSTEKLAKADIDRVTLDKVPEKLAERDGIFPVLYDAAQGVLSVVTADPGNAPALHDLQLASGVKEVRAFVGRPRAVKAAINKAYHGDIHAFAVLDRSAHEQFTSMLNVFERNLVSEESLANALATETGSRERVMSERELMQSGSSAVTSGGRAFTSDSYVETLNVLVTLLENSRADLRGHSAQVARLMRKVSERIGVSDIQRNAFTIAGYLHDLGKMSAYHLTALNVAEYDGHRTAALKLVRSPSRLLEAAHLPKYTVEAVEGMYERFDGQGFPNGVLGKDIPLGARLLAIADTYADLTQNPRNPYRKTLRPAQACEVLSKYKGSVFDPNLVDVFRLTVTGDDVRARLLANRHRVLIIDGDPEETTVLELRLIEQGFEVVQARTSDQALKLLERGDIELVISELDLSPHDGFAVLAEARKYTWGKELPWLVLTGRTSRADAQRAFDSGAVDYLTKPVNADVLVTKLKQVLERAGKGRGPRGVSGSLTEMGLPDIVQVLWHGRKTGSLKIRGEGAVGEIHFVNGAIFNALWGHHRGEEAFYAMLRLKEGDFAMDPGFVASQQVVSASPEALLLEGMRRMDEAER